MFLMSLDFLSLKGMAPTVHPILLDFSPALKHCNGVEHEGSKFPMSSSFFLGIQIDL